MEAALPSYREAITADPWQLICNYLPPSSLCELARVSRKLHQTSCAVLWGNPASHYVSTQKRSDPRNREQVYVALNKFKRILPSVRPEVRALTHTLHLPPAQAELYQRYRAEWLRDFLDLLPNLQSLLVSRLPLFDHAALLNLHRRSRGTSSSYPLRLLDASRCQNTTAQGLTAALSQLVHLVYLDLSETLAVRERGFLMTLRLTPELRVLKLRKTYLRDEDLKIVAEAVQVRIRSLDVRNNYLTDQSVPVILGNCFSSVGISRLRPAYGSANVSPRDDRQCQPDMPYEDVAALEEMQSESYEDSLMRRLTSFDVKASTFGITSHLGLTHLRIADNRLSVDGIAAFIHSKQLRVLDVGSPSNIEDLNRVRGNTANYVKYPDIQPTALGSAQRLIPALESYGGAMTYLRVDHNVVSETPPDDDALPISFHQLHISETDLSPTAAGAISHHDAPPAYEDHPVQFSFSPQTARPLNSKAPNHNDQGNIELIEAQRAVLRQRDPGNPRGLLPGTLPKLGTLVLTQVPCFERARTATDALTSFIHDCAQEARLADIESQMRALPRHKAGEIRISRRKHTAHEIFPLQKLVLEMAPANQVLASTNLSTQNLRPATYINRTKSSTEDADSEAFWAAAEEDFSFFDDAGERDLAGRGFADDDANPNVNSKGRRTMLGSVTAAGYKPMQERLMRTQDLVDVVAELAKFRREKKVEFERVWKMGGRYVDGYWPGEIQITRPYG